MTRRVPTTERIVGTGHLGSRVCRRSGARSPTCACASTTTRPNAASCEVSSQFTRVTTTVVLHGDGETGEGEDVTYTADDHDDFPVGVTLAGHLDAARATRSAWTGSSSSAAEPAMGASRATTAGGRSRAPRSTSRCARPGARSPDAVGREYRPVRFVASTRADIAPYRGSTRRSSSSSTRGGRGTRALMAQLAATDRVRVLDLKAYYRGTAVDLAPDPELYRAGGRELPRRGDRGRVARGRRARRCAVREARLSFDAPIHSLGRRRRACRSSRAGSTSSRRGSGRCSALLECIEPCEARGIAHVRRRPVRARAGTPPDPGARERLLPGRAERRRAVRVQRGPARPGLPQSPLPPPEGVGF